MRKTLLGGTAVIVSAAVAFSLLRGGSPSPAAHASTTSTAKVVRTDLAVTERVTGSLGYDGAFTVLDPAGTAAQAVAQAQQALAADEATLAADRTTLADTDAGNAQAIGQQQDAVNNAHQSAAYDQAQEQQDQAQLAADQHTLAQATAQQAADQTKLNADQATMRAAQQLQLSDQQQQAADQSRLGTDQAALNAAQQTQQSDQHTLTADNQALAAAQRSQQADSQAGAHDCGADRGSSQCAADQSKVNEDNAQVAADQRQCNSDQATVNSDQSTVNADQSMVNNDQSATSADQQRVNSDAKSIQQDGFNVTDDQAAVQQDTANVNAGEGKVTSGEAKVAADQPKINLTDAAQIASAAGALAAAQLNATKAVHQAQAKLDADTIALHAAQDALAGTQRATSGPPASYTWLPKLGDVISEGQPVYAADGAVVPLLYGAVPLYRDLRLGIPDGPDVAELTHDLITMGFGKGLGESNHFSAATQVAIESWQRALGLRATGELTIGQAVVQVGPIRVSTVHPSLGAPVAAGPIVEATSTTKAVTIALSVAKQYLVHAGDAVTILLPDNSTTIGHVHTVSTVATTPANNSSNNPPTVDVTVTLDHATPNLDQAPVSVEIADQSVHQVLAVPINALLALSGGGDAVEVVAGGSRQLVGVRTGVFSSTMVEVSGAGITEGAVVEVPST